MQAPLDRYIRVAGFNTRYWAEGDQGSTVLLLHGIGAYIERWVQNISVLAAYHRVYALDMLGHGCTDKPISFSYSWEAGAQFVKDFMAELGLETASLVGNSMGGGIALSLALKFPEMVEKLVLVDSAGLGKEVPLLLRLATIPVLGEIFTRPSPDSSAQTLRSLLFDPTVLTDEAFELQYRMDAQPGAQKTVLQLLRWAFNPFGPNKPYYDPIYRGLASIHNPTLIVWGRQDQLFPVVHAQRAVKKLPDARVHIFERCGHLPMLEHADAFNALVLEFLGQ